MVKTKFFVKAKSKIATEGSSHLEAILCKLNFKEDYTHNIIQSWRNKLEFILRDIRN